MRRSLAPPNLIAAAITAVAAIAVGMWAMMPVDEPLDYRLGAAQPRDVLSPQYVPALFEGFSSAESWGRWTEGPRATVVFGRPLPKDFTLLLTGHAFGPNIGAPIRLCSGGDCQVIRLKAEDKPARAVFHTRDRTRRLVINVPEPTAPDNGDSRLLGVAVVSLRIEEAADG